MIPGRYALGRLAGASLAPGDSAIVGTSKLYLATEEFVSRGADADPWRRYIGCVTQPLELARSAVGQDVLGGLATIVGAIEVANAGGALDAVLRAGSFVGFPAVVKAVRRGGRLDEAEVVARGLISEEEFDERRVRLRLAPAVDLAARPFQPASFAGTGGLEGGADLKGKRKPAALGRVYGAPLLHLGIVAGRHAFLAAGHRLKAVSGVFERGVAYDFVAADPAAGQWSVDLTTGAVTVGGTPADLGAFTWDGDGYCRADGSWPARTDELLVAALVDFGQAANTTVDYDSLAMLAHERPGIAGWYAGAEETSLADAVRALLEGALAYGGHGRLGRFSAYAVKPPGGVVRARFDETNLLRLQHPRGPTALEPPAWRVGVGWRRCWAPTADVAPGADADRRAFMAEEHRLATASDPAIQARFPTSRSFTHLSTMQDEADAQALAGLLLQTFGATPRRRLRRLLARNAAPALDVGQAVELSNAQFALTERIGTIYGLNLNLARAETELEVLA